MAILKAILSKLKVENSRKHRHDIQNITKEKEQKRSALRGNLIQLTSVQHALHKKKSPPVRPPYMYVCTCIQYMYMYTYNTYSPTPPPHALNVSKFQKKL